MGNPAGVDGGVSNEAHRGPPCPAGRFSAAIQFGGLGTWPHRTTTADRAGRSFETAVLPMQQQPVARVGIMTSPPAEPQAMNEIPDPTLKGRAFLGACLAPDGSGSGSPREGDDPPRRLQLGDM